MLAQLRRDWTLQRIVLPLALLLGEWFFKKIFCCYFLIFVKLFYCYHFLRLFSGCILRINILSLIYGLILFCVPFLSAPSVANGVSCMNIFILEKNMCSHL